MLAIEFWFFQKIKNSLIGQMFSNYSHIRPLLCFGGFTQSQVPVLILHMNWYFVLMYSSTCTCAVYLMQHGVVVQLWCGVLCISGRCQGAPLQTIRENILQGLNLKREPRHQGTGMAELREQWKAAFKVSGHSGLPIQSPPHMSAGTPPEMMPVLPYRKVL